MSVPVFVCNTHATGRMLPPRYTNVKGVLRLQAAPTYIFCMSASCQRTLSGSTSSMARMW